MKGGIQRLASIARKLRVWGIRGVLSFVHHRIVESRIRRMLVDNARRYPCDAPEHGITLIAPLSETFSLSRASLDFAFALKRAGIPFQTFDTNPSAGTAAVDYSGILTPASEFRVTRFDHVVEMFRSPLPDGIVPKRARIAFWEGMHGLTDVFPCLISPATVIAMSDFNAEGFVGQLPAGTPVTKILYPVELGSVAPDDCASVRTMFGIPGESFAVFCNFDVGAYERKNPEAMVRAFAKALGRDDDAHLVFKVNNWGRLKKQQSRELLRLIEELRLKSRFHLVTGYLPRCEIISLTAACDVYISLHRAEGFGLGMVEAMALGKPVIATDYSGSTEFCLPDHSFPIPYKLVPIKPGEYFEAMKEWAEADVDAAAAALLRLHDSPKLRAEIGRKAKAFVEDHFSTENFRKSVEAFLDFQP